MNPTASRRQHSSSSRVLTVALVSILLAGSACHGASPTSPPDTTPPSGIGLPSGSVPTPTGAPPATTEVPRPPIVWKPIPFDAKRRSEMVAYAERHYGLDTWKLRDPHVIVEHYTGGSSFESAFGTFAQDVPDPELHELPGLCAHFVIDTDGTIYQLVPLTTMCRHTVGLNWTAIGIEDVGTSDLQILRDRRQLRASLMLTVWLMQRFHIQLRNVIGHSESLTSPYHRELDPRYRCQTHSDWSHDDMRVYRGDLAAVADRYQVPLGPPVRPVPSGC